MQTRSDEPRRTSEQAFVFEGQLNSASFTEFARHRAARLDLILAIQAHTDQSVRLSVDGQPDLIDMFEMAMSLGPQDCIVLDVTRLR
jgi:acylphosphatase